MTPERRKELRRCDEACFRTRTARQLEEKDKRIKELESTVITDNTETLANALERIKVLESLLVKLAVESQWLIYSLEYHLLLIDTVNAKEILKEIDAILPSTEEVK